MSQSIVYRVLKQTKISRKKAHGIEPQSAQLRRAWQADMLNHIVEQLIFIDESLFKAQTSWRSMAYESTDDSARWPDDIRRESTFNILSTYTIEGYLLCTSIKQDYYNDQDFYD